MAYSTINDILARIPEKILIQLTDDDNTGAYDEDRANTAISDADTLIDLYLAEKYVTPVLPSPDVLTRLSVDIAVYFIYSARYDNVIPAEIREKYLAAFDRLELFRNGGMKLPGATLLDSNEDSVLSSKDISEMEFDDEMLDKM